MSEDVRIRACPWSPCVHRIDEDGDVVHMREGVFYNENDEEYQGGEFGSIIASIDVQQRSGSATVMDFCIKHDVLASPYSRLPHPCEVDLLRGGHGAPCDLTQVNVEISELLT